MMLSLGNKSKLFLALTKSLPQAVKIPTIDRQVRGYADRREDEDIKWQWAVRDSPCQLCYKYKAKRGWLAKIFKKKKCEDELTNRHNEKKYQPKFWELGYYSYLLPNCDKQISLKLNKTKLKHKKLPANKYAVCGPKNEECEGKQILVHLSSGFDELKTCTEKLNFQTKEPFCLNEVCGKTKPPKKEKCGDNKSEFLCLNHLIENKQKSGGDLSSQGTKDSH